MPTFSTLQRASFLGSAFPVSSVDVQGGIRDHLHEYPHAQGAAVEKLGRKLYTIKMEALFHTTFAAYPNLWPNTLAALRVLFETQTTGALVIPTIGTIQAYCRNWNEIMSSKSSSGVSASFEFVEDQKEALLISSLVSVNVSPLQKAIADYQAATQNLNDFAGDKTSESLFDGINDIANSILAIGDQAQVYGNLLDSKLLGLVSLIDQFDKATFANDFKNFFVVDALHNLWDTVNTTVDNIKSNQISPETYTVPNTMSMSMISQAIYGDTSHAVELMQLNAVEDVFAVKAGTKLRYIPATSSKATIGLTG